MARPVAQPRRRWIHWILPVLAALAGATVVSTLLVLLLAPDGPVAPAAYRPPAHPSDTSREVSVEMRRVNYLVAPDLPLQVRYLKGVLVPTGDSVPEFGDGTSYRTRIEAAEIFVDTLSLARLIGRFVFGYRGAPVRDLHVGVDGGRLVQRGKLGSAPFTIRSSVSLTDRGEIRLHPEDIKVLGIRTDGLMDRLGLELEEILKVRGGRGLRIAGNDMLLDVAAILPPPRIEGRLAAVRVEPGGLVQRFGEVDSVPARRFFGDSLPASSFMAYRGGVIRFGKLTMRGTDLTIVDQDRADPLGFYLPRYHDQLVAGVHRTTPEDGLVVWMPDVDQLD